MSANMEKHLPSDKKIFSMELSPWLFSSFSSSKIAFIRAKKNIDFEYTCIKKEKKHLIFHSWQNLSSRGFASIIMKLASERVNLEQ